MDKELLEKYLEEGLTQREIAKKYGRNEASISRTVKDFLEKIKKGY